MELTYLVRGADGKQYGPVGLEQLEGWIREGRLPNLAQVQRSDMPHWATAEDFLELQPAFASRAEDPAATDLAAKRHPAGIGRAKSDASWFRRLARLFR